MSDREPADMQGLHSLGDRLHQQTKHLLPIDRIFAIQYAMGMAILDQPPEARLSAAGMVARVLVGAATGMSTDQIVVSVTTVHKPVE